eukprot:SAG22_NODE_2173_length_2893_cov_3.127774_4_plen_65_part_00
MAERNGFPVMHGEKSYAQMIAHFEEYNDVAGDSPLNFCHTTQVCAACLCTDCPPNRPPSPSLLT